MKNSLFTLEVKKSMECRKCSFFLEFACNYSCKSRYFFFLSFFNFHSLSLRFKLLLFYRLKNLNLNFISFQKGLIDTYFAYISDFQECKPSKIYKNWWKNTLVTPKYKNLNISSWEFFLLVMMHVIKQTWHYSIGIL